MNQRTNILFFLTSSYPYKNAEVFIENEIVFLEKFFDKIYIICSEETKNKRYTPINSEILTYNISLTKFQKFISLKNILLPIFWSELYFILFTLKQPVTLKRIKILLAEYSKAKHLQKYLLSLIKSLNDKTISFYLYSYWNDYKAISLALLKQENNMMKCFSRAHGWDIYFNRHNENYLPLKPFIFKNTDAIFFVAEDGLNAALKILNKKSYDKFKLSRLGTINKFQPKQYSLSETIKIVSCSNVIPVKRVHLIVESLALLSEIKIYWEHFGDGQNLTKIKTLAHNLISGKKNIEYKLHGYTPNFDILGYYQNYTPELFINVSSSEGVPVSIMEAMSFGMPVIGTAVGGVPEIIEHNHNGFLLSPNPTPHEIAETITKYFYLPEDEKLRLRQNAYNTWNEKYNAKKNYPKFVEAILNL